jgi:hypothetical protein
VEAKVTAKVVEAKVAILAGDVETVREEAA